MVLNVQTLDPEHRTCTNTSIDRLLQIATQYFQCSIVIFVIMYLSHLYKAEVTRFNVDLRQENIERVWREFEPGASGSQAIAHRE